MLLEIFMKGYVGLRFLLTLKMDHKRRKVENHCSSLHSIFPKCIIRLISCVVVFEGRLTRVVYDDTHQCRGGSSQ